jgi:Ras-related protein Rab-39B
VYDITNRSSFEHIPLWMMEARRHIEPHRPVFALVGCKLDLVSSGQREVTREEARAFAEQNGLHHVETSAKTGANVEEAFHAVTQEVYSRIQTGEYKIEDGWDGIKTGFQRPGGLDFNLVEAEPAKSTCC